MGEILNTIGDAIGAIFDNPILQFGLRAVAVYIVILWLAAAYWAFRDIQLRTENPIAPYLVASMVILFTPVFFALAVFIYRIIRPQEKIGEVYERNLAEEALLAEVEAIKSCPNCNRRVDEEWNICPSCRTRLNRVCPNCGRLVGLEQDQARGGDVEREPEERGDEEHARKGCDLERVAGVERHQQQDDGERQVRRDQHVEQRRRQRHDHQADDQDHERGERRVGRAERRPATPERERSRRRSSRLVRRHRRASLHLMS